MLTEPLPLLPLGRARRGAVVGAINPKLLYADGGFKQRAVVIPSFRQVSTRQADARLKYHPSLVELSGEFQKPMEEPPADPRRPVVAWLSLWSTWTALSPQPHPARGLWAAALTSYRLRRGPHRQDIFTRAAGASLTVGCVRSSVLDRAAWSP